MWDTVIAPPTMGRSSVLARSVQIDTSLLISSTERQAFSHEIGAPSYSCVAYPYKSDYWSPDEAKLPLTSTNQGRSS